MIHGGEEKYFLLKVEGTSMNNFRVNNKYIDNGSYVLINKDETQINEQDAFLFIVNNAATIKATKREGESLYLLPKSNDDFHKPIVLSGDDDVMVNGRVVDVFNFGN
ncbi:MAG: helix-turn-helix transcriptional regulator [Candidatus Peribacteria bacterium]|nr:MAG: helix-turn-helix transcriptional regulator [Candidatus Peribacteria bacterium]